MTNTEKTIIRPSNPELVMWIVAALIKCECKSAEKDNRNPLTSLPLYGRNSRVKVPLPFNSWSTERSCYHEVAVQEDGSFIIWRKSHECNREDPVACLNFPIPGLEGRFDRPLDLDQYNYWVKKLEEGNDYKFSLEKEVE